MRIRLLSLLVVLAALAPAVRATSVVPPSFRELVAEADAIYEGTVASVQARRVAAPNGDSIVKTFVTVTIDRVLKGPEKTDVTLEFLGGTVGEDSLVVSGMPTFAVGSREFVFVQKNGVQFCPLVALTHGRYRVMREAGGAREFVARDNGMPLTDTAQVEQPMREIPAAIQSARTAGAPANALTPDAFAASIAAEVKALPQNAVRD